MIPRQAAPRIVRLLQGFPIEFARTRPAEFLRQFPAGAVIDEAQNAPELFSQLQGVVDASGKVGLFVLTGSQNLSLLSNVTRMPSATRGNSPPSWT